MATEEEKDIVDEAEDAVCPNCGSHEICYDDGHNICMDCMMEWW